jgi:hypothetical protein
MQSDSASVFPKCGIMRTPWRCRSRAAAVLAVDFGAGVGQSSLVDEITVRQVPGDDDRVGDEGTGSQNALNQNGCSVAAARIDRVRSRVLGERASRKLAPESRVGIELPARSQPHRLYLRCVAYDGEGRAAERFQCGGFRVGEEGALARKNAVERGGEAALAARARCER